MRPVDRPRMPALPQPAEAFVGDDTVRAHSRAGGPNRVWKPVFNAGSHKATAPKSVVDCSVPCAATNILINSGESCSNHQCQRSSEAR